MVTSADVRRLAEELDPYVVQCRRTVHRLAEVGGHETKTCAFVRGQLDEDGIPWRAVPGADTATIGLLDTGRPGHCVMLRADIDALPIAEDPDNLAGPRVVCSEGGDTCHACGHDGHTAMLLGAARALARLNERGELSGQFVLVFEAGEENWTSYHEVIDALRDYPVEACWGIHVYSALESGKICVDAGPRMAGIRPLDVVVHGRGGHGSRPDMAANPVFAAADMLVNLSVAWVNQMAPDKPVTLSPTLIDGGTAYNVIPSDAEVKGSLRFFDADAGERAMAVVRSVAEHTAAMHGCTAEVREVDNPPAPVVNDERAAALASRALSGVLPTGTVAACPRWNASETFGCYQRLYPGVFAHLGINNPAAGTGAPHHTARFDVDENVLRIGVAATLAYAAAFAAGGFDGRLG